MVAEATGTLVIVFLLVVCILLAGRYVWTKIKPSLKKNKYRFESILMASAVKPDSQRQVFRGQLYQSFLMGSGSAQYSTRETHNSVIADLLKERLDSTKDGEFIMTVEIDMCDMDTRSCDTTFKLVSISGNEIYLQMSMIPRSFKDDKGRNLWVMTRPGIEITDYVTPEERLVIGENVRFIFSTNLSDDHEDVKAVFAAIEGAKAEYVYHEDERPAGKHIVNNLVYYDGHLALSDTYTATRDLANPIVDTLFMPIEVSLAGVKKYIAASYASTIAAQALENGENVFLRGVTGTGKTTLSDIIQARLSTKRNVRIVNISPRQVWQFDDIRFSTEFERLFSHDKNEENPIMTVFIIDEAEMLIRRDAKSGTHSAANTFMLELLDGSLKKKLNCSTMLTFNADSMLLSQQVERSGRMHLSYTVEPLDTEHSLAAIAHLKGAMMNKIFDEEEYRKFIDNDSSDSVGNVYAKKGRITLADLTGGCFRRKNQQDLLLKAIQGATPQGQPVKQQPVVPGPKGESKVETNGRPKAAPGKSK